MQTIFGRILPFKSQSVKEALSLGVLIVFFGLGGQAFAQQATSVEGHIILSNQENVANASIYIADLSTDSLLEPNHKKLFAHQLNGKSPDNAAAASSAKDILKDGSSCIKPQFAVLSFACSDDTGHFNLSLPSVPALPLVVTVAKNGMTMNITLDLDDLGGDVGEIALDAAQLGEKLDRIAIVDNVTPFVKSRLNEKAMALQSTGDAMDSEFLLGYGLDVIQSNVEYPGFAALFRDDNHDGRLDIFNYSTVLLKTSWKTVLSQIDPSKRQVLLDYVEQGGQLLITNKRQPKLTSIEGFI